MTAADAGAQLVVVPPRPAGCPFLLAEAGGWRLDAPSRDHRCAAFSPAAPLAPEKQARLCLTEDDQTDADDWLLSDIHPADRIAFFNWCNGVHTEAAATVEPFPDRPAEDVATGGPGGVDSDAAERSAPAA